MMVMLRQWPVTTSGDDNSVNVYPTGQRRYLAKPISVGGTSPRPRTLQASSLVRSAPQKLTRPVCDMEGCYAANCLGASSVYINGMDASNSNVASLMSTHDADIKATSIFDRQINGLWQQNTMMLNNYMGTKTTATPTSSPAVGMFRTYPGALPAPPLCTENHPEPHCAFTC